MVKNREGCLETEGRIVSRIETIDGGLKKGGIGAMLKNREGGLETEGRIMSRLENRDGG